MILVECDQGSDAWRTARAGLATASCFADILAKSRTKGDEAASRRNLRIRLVLERMTGRSASGFESFATRQGHEREPLARLAYEIETGEIVRQVGFCRHDSLEAGASPDGWVGNDGGIEIKSPEPSAHLEVLRTRSVPSQYVAQVQGNLWICSRRWWRFVSFNPDFPEALQLAIVDVQRDEAYIDRLRTEVAVFMEEVRAEEAEVRGLARQRAANDHTTRLAA